MARNNQRGTTTRRAPKDLGRRVKKKPCALCRDRTEWVDYKDVPMLRKYMSDRGKIRSRRVTGNCAQHQRALAQAIKTARELILLPYTQRTVTERPGGRGGGRDRGERGERGERAERTLSDTIGADAPRDRDASVEILSDVAAFDRSDANGSADGDGANGAADADAARTRPERCRGRRRRQRGWRPMRVLLRDDVDGVGRRGDIVKVAGGFARNFLLPEGRAIVATDGVEGQAEQMRRGRDLREAKKPRRGREPGDDPGRRRHSDLGQGRRRRSALRFDRSGRRGGGHPRPQGCGDRPQARAPARAHQGSGLLRRHRGVVHGRCNSGNSGGHGRFLSGGAPRVRAAVTALYDHGGVRTNALAPPQVVAGCPQPHRGFGGSNPQLVALVPHSSLRAELGDRGSSL